MNFKNFILFTFHFILFTLYFHLCSAQSITGNLSLLSGLPIKLEGFHGLNSYTISETTIDSTGNFTLQYSKSDHGMGILTTTDGKAYYVLLTDEDAQIKGQALSMPETIQCAKSRENQLFEQYAQEHPRREQALSALNYLEKIYEKDPLFASQYSVKKTIQNEINRIKTEDETFLSSLPADSYVRWYLPVRKLLSAVSTIAQHRQYEIPQTIKALLSIRYDDPRLYKSGLLRDAIDSHVWFVENTSSPQDTMYSHLHQYIDHLLAQISHDEKKYNEITDYLFNLLEKRSLYNASEYLSLRVLEQNSCTVDHKLAQKLEGYRKLKPGNIAPNINFADHTYYPDHITAKTIKDIKATYKVVVFAASWCPHCVEALPKLAQLYPIWQAKGIEVVFVSLDEQVMDFAQIAGALPFVSTCDYQKWESKPVKDYHVFGTPTYFILKDNLEIVLKPTSVEQISAYFDWALR